MTKNMIAKSLVVAALAGAFAVANADDFSLFTSSQAGSPSNPSLSTINETFSILPPSGGDPNQYDTLSTPLTWGSVSFTETGPLTSGSVPVNGTFTLYGATAADTLTFKLDPSVSYFGKLGSRYSGELIGNLVGTGTGAFASYTSGYADLVVNYSLKNGKWGDTGSVTGEVQSVPEPASLAVLGLGVAGLIARRRKA